MKTNSRNLWWNLTLVLFATLTPSHSFAAEVKCWVAYKGCATPGSKCMPAVPLDQLEKQLITAFTNAPDEAIQYTCDTTKPWKAVDKVAQFKPLFDQYAKHWYVQVGSNAQGPFSRDTLKAMKNGEVAGMTLDNKTKLWSGARMGRAVAGKAVKFVRAEAIDEIVFNVLNEPSTEEVTL